MSRQLHVASVTANLHFGGDAKRLLTLARTIDTARFRHTVLVIVPPSARRDEEAGSLAAEYRRHGIAVHYLPVPSPHRASHAPRHRIGRVGGAASWGTRVVWSLSRWLRRNDVHVVDARGAHASAISVLATRLLRVPVVGTGYAPEAWKQLLGRFGSWATFRAFDAFITDSRVKLDAFGEHFGPPGRGAVIPNGIFPPTDSKRTREEMRHALGLPTDPAVRVVGQIARLRPNKGQPQLIAAARHVLDRDANVAFLICGYANRAPDFVRSLKRQCDALGIRDRVVVTSYPGPVDDLWQTIDLHCHPTLYDSSPIAIHESMALGLPAVVTHIGGIPDLVDDGKSGLIVAPGDEYSLADALLELLGDANRARAMGDAARRRFASRHDPHVMARAHEDLYLALSKQRVTLDGASDAARPSTAAAS